ncbi:MAG: hypothetical protein JJV97_00960 [SAR324 cluster bacterium]|nr:hypothetical protein [SAR324 cluster bacterium]
MTKGYYSVISQSLFGQKLFGSLRHEIEQGIKQYSDFSQNRLKKAIQCFSPRMKQALYEIIFLLHYNDPSLAQHYVKVSAKELLARKATTSKIDFNLYSRGVPAGVLGFDKLSQIFYKDMQEHIEQEFKVDISKIRQPAVCPIVSLASLGSIGTIAHKLEKSDLDLQIQYDIFPYLLGAGYCSDAFFEKMFYSVTQWYENTNKAKSGNAHNLESIFPLIFKFQKKPFEVENLNIYFKLVNELTRMYDLYQNRVLYGQKMRLEKALQDRIKRILSYIKSKYSGEDIYFFAYSTENYRIGKHGSTLESKESSGSAYEKILTYDTLMPGIQYNSVVPSHFLFGDSINNNEPLYKALISCFRLRLFDGPMWKAIRFPAQLVIDLGNSPLLSNRYLSEHRGAIYWEAFKGSSGNLPKSFLNLLRLENLYGEDENRQSIIQLIKKPSAYRDLLAEVKAKADKQSVLDPYGLGYDEQDPFPLQDVYRIELQNPDLLYDPWWWRYKTIKIFYTNINNLDYQTKQDISLMIDVCFTLHIGMDDIFLSHNVKLNATESARIRIINDFFENAFPALTEKRKFIEQVFLGDLSSVNHFETRLKKHFKNTISRILKDKSTSAITAREEEKEIWLQYYEQNFEPKEHQIPRNILSNIHKLKGRLQIKFDDQKWHFKTIPAIKNNSLRFHVFGILKNQDKTVKLHVDDDMVRGLTYCIINNFYGAYAKQAIKMSTSLVEFNPQSFSGLSTHDQKHAKLTAELIEIMSGRIAARFPKMMVDYREVINSKFKVMEVIFLINVLVFGRIHAVYRDHMDNFYMVSFDHQKINQTAYKYLDKRDEFLAEDEIISSISKFVQKFSLGEKDLRWEGGTVSYWLNPLSVASESAVRVDHLMDYEKEVADILHGHILKKLSLMPDDPNKRPGWFQSVDHIQQGNS